MASFVYNKFKSELMKGAINLTSDTIKVALFTSSLTTADKDDASFSDAPYTLWEHTTTDSGYTQGGATLGSKSITCNNALDAGMINGADVTWSGSNITARYAVIYDDTHATKCLIAFLDFATDLSSSEGDFTVQWDNNPAAIISIT